MSTDYQVIEYQAESLVRVALTGFTVRSMPNTAQRTGVPTEAGKSVAVVAVMGKVADQRAPTDRTPRANTYQLVVELRTEQRDLLLQAMETVEKAVHNGGIPGLGYFKFTQSRLMERETNKGYWASVVMFDCVTMPTM